MGGRGSSSGAKRVDKSLKNDIIGNDNNRTAVADVHYIGVINLEIYKGITEKAILTNQVIITDNQINHIIARRGQEFYERYHKDFENILSNPDYIFKDGNADTAIVCKRFFEQGKSINIVLKLAVEGDNPLFKNSIITVIGENDKRFSQRLRNNTPIYQKKNIDKSE